MKRFMFAAMAIVAIAFTSCEKGEVSKGDVIQLTSSDQTMYYGDKFQIDATSDTPITYTSENEYHAEVSTSGLVTAGRVGETNIVLTNGEDTKTVKITIRPKSNLYPEPNLTFGMSRSAVKTKLGTPDSETATGIGYMDWSNTAPTLLCLFNDHDNLDGYALLVKSSYTSDLTTFLLERYITAVLPDDGDIIAIFVNGLDLDTATMAVSLGIYDLSNLMVLYSPLPIPDTKSAADRSEIIKSIEELMSK